MCEIFSQLSLHCFWIFHHTPVISGLISDTQSERHRLVPSARATAGSYRQCNHLQKLFYSRFNSSNVFFTSLTCMPSPIEKKPVLLIKFTPHASQRRWVWGCGSAFYPCFDQAVSFLVIQSFLYVCMCCGFVPEFCGEVTPEKWVFLDLLLHLCQWQKRDEQQAWRTFIYSDAEQNHHMGMFSGYGQ